MIPANLHYKNPNPDIPGLVDGRLKVVSDRTKWNGGKVGVNSFGFGGSNVHVLMETNTKPLAETHIACESRRLFLNSSRTKEGLENLLMTMNLQANNIELQALLSDSANIPPSSHPYRGYSILNSKEEIIEIQVSLLEQKNIER